METFSLKKHKGPYIETFLIFLIKLGMPKAKIMSLFFSRENWLPLLKKVLQSRFMKKLFLLIPQNSQ